MIIGFDLDGVIADHTLAKIKIAADLGWKIEKKDTPSEVLRVVLPREILQIVQHNLYKKVHSGSILMPGAFEVVSKIRASRIDYFLVSRRNDPQSAIKFLAKNKLWPDYFNDSNSFFVIEKEDKNKKAKELGITHYIDDEAEVLEKLKSVEKRFLFDSHNVFPEKSFYTKVSSWKDIKKQLHI